MNFTKLQSILENQTKIGTPAQDFVLMQNNKEIFRYTAGYKDKEKTIKASQDDVYFLYSASKVVTCTLALRLVEQGKLGLNDNVSKYLPEFEKLTVQTENGVIKAENELKIHHLFSMTGGIAVAHLPKEIGKHLPENERTTRNLVKEIAKFPLAFEPGTHFNYNFNHDVLAAVVEEIAQKDFRDFIAQEIFNPLEMKSSTYFETNQIKEKMWEQYRFNESSNSFDVEGKTNIYILSSLYDSGGAGMISNANDYIKVSAALANSGVAFNNYRLLNRETIDLMRTNRLNPVQLSDLRNTMGKPGYGYGLGVRTLIEKETSRGPLGEFGWDSAANAYTFIDVDNNLSAFYGLHVLGWGPGYNTHPILRDAVYEGLGL